MCDTCLCFNKSKKYINTKFNFINYNINKIKSIKIKKNILISDIKKILTNNVDVLYHNNDCIDIYLDKYFLNNTENIYNYIDNNTIFNVKLNSIKKIPIKIKCIDIDEIVSVNLYTNIPIFFQKFIILEYLTNYYNIARTTLTYNHIKIKPHHTIDYLEIKPKSSLELYSSYTPRPKRQLEIIIKDLTNSNSDFIILYCLHELQEYNGCFYNNNNNNDIIIEILNFLDRDYVSDIRYKVFSILSTLSTDLIEKYSKYICFYLDDNNVLIRLKVLSLIKKHRKIILNNYDKILKISKKDNDDRIKTITKTILLEKR